MRLLPLAAVALAVPMLAVAAPSARAQQLPYDPYPWCAVYNALYGGASNCGFRTYAQCMATVSGVGGFCAPNQFYNPDPRAPRGYRPRYRRN